MFETYFFHDTIKTYTGVMGYLFKDIKIESNGKMVKVPIEFLAKNKSNVRRDQDISETKISKTLPRITYNLVAYDKDLSRKTNKLLTMVGPASDNKVNVQYNRVPYNFTYEFNLKTKNIGEMTQLIEQICPYFSDPISVDVKDNDDLQSETDISIGLLSEDDVSTAIGSFDDYRTIETRLTFVLKGYLYMPTSERSRISKIIINYGDLETEILQEQDIIDE